MCYYKKLIRTICLSILIMTVSIRAGEIHDAAAAGDLNKVKVLLEANPNLLESKDKNGFTPLLKACQTGKEVIADFLLDKGANVNAVDNFNNTPLIRSCQIPDQNVDFIQKLIDKGADVNYLGYNGNSPLHWAACRGNYEVAEFLIDKGADVNISDKYTGPVGPSSISGTVLQVAVNYTPNEKLASFLVEKGARINQRDYFGNTILHLAALKGCADLAGILVEHGIDINAINQYNHTALYYAAKHGYRRTAEVLVAAGADEKTIGEANFGKAQQLTAKLKDGEAYLWNIDGYVIKTKEHLLLPNPGGIDDSKESGLANGHINPDELADQNITLLLSYIEYQADYYEPQVLELVKRMPEINVIFSIKPKFNNNNKSDLPNYNLAVPNNSFFVDDIKVNPVPAMGGNMGYLIEVDGMKIYYSGYHTNFNDTIQKEKYHEEIEKLRTYAPIDIAVLNIKGHVNVGFEPDHFVLNQLSPKAVFLMDANVKEEYEKCFEALQSHNIQIKYPEGGLALGERFHYIRE